MSKSMPSAWRRRRGGTRRAAGLAVLVAVGGWLVPATGEVTSIGDFPCSEWAARRGDGARVDPPQMWLAGFMTGLATALRIDVLAITDASAMFAWMDDFCTEHPDELLSTGAGLLFNELLARLPDGPSHLTAR
ncbi:MAG: hypothetical protein AB7Q81_07885 [Gammaproteobacteria bacterium]